VSEANKKSRIFLTGFMGSGKSTIAPLLAHAIGYDFLDIDAEIEKRVGKSITEIFQQRGEAFFRNIERAILQELPQKEHCVISLGGGTLAHNDNLHLIKSSGILVYLKADPEKLVHRLKNKTDRPLLKSADGTRLDETALRSRINQLMTSREPFYNQADLIILTDNKHVGATIDEIVKQIHKLIE
jgi:shikimate kinase